MPAPLLEAAMAVLQAAPDGRLNIVLLNKALFYLDLVALRDLGATITGAKYVAIENGPVVAKYQQKLVGELEKAGLATQSQDGLAKPVAAAAPVAAFEHLSPTQLGKVEPVVRYIAAMTSTQASAYAHKNPGWRIAYNGPGAPGGIIDMRIAMQQILEADPWLETPLTANEMAAVSSDDQLFDW